MIHKSLFAVYHPPQVGDPYWTGMYPACFNGQLEDWRIRLDMPESVTIAEASTDVGFI